VRDDSGLMVTPPQSRVESRVSRPHGHDAYASDYRTVPILAVQGQGVVGTATR
jgi:hypothetical protein